ncbi:recombinase family protein [Kribbella qitaiheensis]|uniref:Recombinase family protein n=1 Tax=Kribbella qitaiheensis TaxID=1544730 RepID=A0A7G6X6R8_9ACTN|nr:recombinase family protein [Kribbella qitaiheensis]QNE21933.1 recombinase family protein [Kribbella qitaiheensis]
MTARLTKAQAPARRRAVIYARISRDDTDEGLKTRRQIEKCRALCDLRGWDVVVIEEDISISAYSGKERPAWQRVLKMVGLGQVDVIVAWHLDRITRSMLELEELILLSEQHDVGVATVTGDIDLTTDVGQMVARILAAVARAEVQRKAARQRLANEQRANAGAAWTAGVRRFAYTADMELIPAEVEALVQARKDVLAGMSRAEVARRWDQLGFQSGHAASTKRKTPTKAGWTTGGVTRVLSNPVYAGIRAYHGVEVANGDWPAVFTRDEHLEIKLFLDRLANGKSKGPKPTTLLSSLALCATCGDPVRAGSDRGIKTYACGASGHVSTLRQAADEFAHATAIALLESQEVLSLLLPSDDHELDEAKREHAELDAKLKSMARLFALNAMTEDQVVAGTAEVLARIAELESILRRAPGLSLLADLAVGTKLVKAQWVALPLARQRAILDLLFDIELAPTGGKRGSKLSTPIDEQVVIADKVA